jgi:hypothetical protein
VVADPGRVALPGSDGVVVCSITAIDEVTDRVSHLCRSTEQEVVGLAEFHHLWWSLPL